MTPEQLDALRLDLVKHGAPPRIAALCAETPTEPDKAWGPRLTERSAYIWGDVGRGKTHLAVTLLRVRLANRLNARFVVCEDLAREFKRTFDGGWPDEETLRLRYGKEYPWLCVDDVGRGYDPNGFAVDTLDSIVAKRWDQGLPSVITTQLAPERFKAKYGEAGARLLSRILGGGAAIHLDGTDRRQAPA